MKYCPNCNQELSIRTRLGLRLFGSRGEGFAPAIQCPSCSYWLRMRTLHGILMSSVAITLLIIGFVLHFHIIIIFAAILITTILFRLFATYTIYQYSTLNIVNNYRIEGNNNDQKNP